MDLKIFGIILFALPAMIAISKGRNFFLWFLYGLLLFPIALVHSILIKSDNKKQEKKKTSEQKIQEKKKTKEYKEQEKKKEKEEDDKKEEWKKIKEFDQMASKYGGIIEFYRKGVFSSWKTVYGNYEPKKEYSFLWKALMDDNFSLKKGRVNPFIIKENPKGLVNNLLDRKPEHFSSKSIKLLMENIDLLETLYNTELICKYKFYLQSLVTEKKYKQDIVDSIYKNYPNYSDLKGASINQLTALRGVGKVTATEIKDFMQEKMKLNTSQSYYQERF